MFDQYNKKINNVLAIHESTAATLVKGLSIWMFTKRITMSGGLIAEILPAYIRNVLEEVIDAVALVGDSFDFQNGNFIGRRFTFVVAFYYRMINLTSNL